jgi:hypothetical protein
MASDPSAPAQSATADGERRFRHVLASGMLIVSIVGVVVISGLAIWLATSDNRPAATQLVFSSVLPLFGTWVGTVLAFYFARDNLTAATDNTLKLQSAVAAATPTEPSLTDEMVPAAQINAYDIPAGTAPGDVTLDTLYKAMGTVNPPSRRLPIRDASSAVLFVLHDSTLSDWAVRVQEPIDRLTGRLQDMLSDAEFAGLIRAIAWVPQNGTISQARAQMKAVPNCNDVFVTATGKETEPVLGWLTNTALAGIG